MEVLPELNRKRRARAQWVKVSVMGGKVEKKCFLSRGEQRYEGLWWERESMVLLRTTPFFRDWHIECEWRNLVKWLEGEKLPHVMTALGTTL